MRNTSHLRIVEDSASDAQLIARNIESAGYAVRWERTDDAPGLQAALKRADWDVILCDHGLAEFSGLAALALVRATGQDVPFIIVSGTMGEDTAVAAMKAGAHDYALKGNLQRLVPAIEHELREVEMHQHQHQRQVGQAGRDFLFYPAGSGSSCRAPNKNQTQQT